MEDNRLNLYISTQKIDHGLAFSIGGHMSLYKPRFGEKVTFENFKGPGWQRATGAGPFVISESCNYDDYNFLKGNKFNGVGIGGGIGLPIEYSEGYTNTKFLFNYKK